MATVLTQDSELALQLQNIVQPKLVEAGWSAGDSTLAEYIVLMLVNGKDKDQVASELANDLLSLGPEDQNTREFAQWLFDQVASLTGQTSETSAQAFSTEDAAAPQSIPTQPTSDADMASSMDVEQIQGIPTGPKSMRSGPNTRGAGRRQMSHASRAMDRSNDAMLHKVRNNSSERIGRNTPRGSRGGMHGGQLKGMQGGRTGSGTMSSTQQNQLMQFMNQQMEMMQHFMTGQNSPGFNMNGTAINPNFRGRPIADRVNGSTRGGGKFAARQTQSNNGQNQNGANTQTGDTEMGGEGVTEEESNNQSNPETTICRWNIKCNNAHCPYAHQSPAAPMHTTIDMSIPACNFGAACQNRKCVARHPSPQKRAEFQAEQECKYWPNCTNPNCSFRHPTERPCKFGGDCTVSDCKFAHNRTLCKHNPCINPRCIYKHAEGQKKDSKWVKSDNDVKMGADHVSERKFVSEDGVQGEELIKPGAPETSQTADVVT